MYNTEEIVTVTHYQTKKDINNENKSISTPHADVKHTYVSTTNGAIKREKKCLMTETKNVIFFDFVGVD